LEVKGSEISRPKESSTRGLEVKGELIDLQLFRCAGGAMVDPL